MSVTFSADGMPPHHDPDVFGGEHDVNMCTRNAALVADSLGIDLDDDSGCEMPAADFLGRVLMALSLAPRDEGMPSHVQVTTGAATFIEGSRPEGYLQDRLVQLHTLAEWAVSNDALVWWS